MSSLLVQGLLGLLQGGIQGSPLPNRLVQLQPSVQECLLRLQIHSKITVGGDMAKHLQVYTLGGPQVPQSAMACGAD